MTIKPILTKILYVNPVQALINANLPVSTNPVKFDKFVNISQDLDSDTFNYIYGLKSTIGNYAKKEGLQIDVYKASEEMGEHDFPTIENFLNGKIALKVKNKLLGNEQIELVEEKLSPKVEEPAFSRKIFLAIQNAKEATITKFMKEKFGDI